MRFAIALKFAQRVSVQLSAPGNLSSLREAPVLHSAKEPKRNGWTLRAAKTTRFVRREIVLFCAM